MSKRVLSPTFKALLIFSASFNVMVSVTKILNKFDSTALEHIGRILVIVPTAVIVVCIDHVLFQGFRGSPFFIHIDEDEDELDRREREQSNTKRFVTYALYAVVFGPVLTLVFLK